MGSRQRLMVALLALQRLRAPMFAFAMPSDWGVDIGLIDSMLSLNHLTLGSFPEEEFRQNFVNLSSSPLFQDEQDPDLIQTFQLETIGGLEMLSEALGSMSVEETKYIALIPRGMANYLDRCIEAGRTGDPLFETHRAYLKRLDDIVRGYGLGYFGSRNIEVEWECSRAIAAADQAGAGDVEIERSLAACHAFSDELAQALREDESFLHVQGSSEE